MTTVRQRTTRAWQALLAALDRDATAWDVSPATGRTVFFAPVAVAVLVALSAAWRPLFRLFVEEDGIIEWLQVVMLLVIAVTSAVIARRLQRRGHPWWALCYVFAALGALFIAGEEISWGQRLLGWGTPEVLEELEELNEQGETNLHNIGVTLVVFNGAMMAIAAAGVVLSLARDRFAALRSGSIAAVVLVPPTFVTSGLVIAFTYRLIRTVFLPHARFTVSRYQEVTEALFYFSALVFVVLVARRLRRSDQPDVGA